MVLKPTLSAITHTYGYVVDIKKIILAFRLNIDIKKELLFLVSIENLMNT